VASILSKDMGSILHQCGKCNLANGGFDYATIKVSQGVDEIRSVSWYGNGKRIRFFVWSTKLNGKTHMAV